mgnify:CR=1 FL=1
MLLSRKGAMIAVKKRIGAALSALSTLLVLLSAFPAAAEDAAAPAAEVSGTAASDAAGTYTRLDGYDAYLAQYADVPHAAAEFSVRGADAQSFDEGAAHKETIDGREVLVTEASGRVTWRFTVPETGLYNLSVTYYNIEGNGTDIERTLYLDGKIPFEEVRALTFFRTWRDEGEKRFGKTGNEYRRTQVEERCFTVLPLRADTGYRDDTFAFYLTAGEHTLSLEAVSDRMAIESLRFYHESEIPTYADWLSAQTAQPVQGDTALRIQTEDAVRRSAATLYAVEDRTSPLTEPYAIDRIQLNCIGGDTWRYQGDWIEWTVDVPSDGLYRLMIRAKQSYNSGVAATRTLYVNGAVPYKEAQDLEFVYGNTWQTVAPRDENGELCYIYLHAGENTLRLQNTLGELGSILRGIEESAQELDRLYRRIRMVVGSTPDQNRDYKLESYIPDLNEIVSRQYGRFETFMDELDALGGGKGEQTTTLEQIHVMLGSFLERPRTIPLRVQTLSDNLSSLSSWILGVSEQPLLLDCIDILPEGAPLTRAEAPWYSRLWNELCAFGYSFVGDYSLIESADGTQGDTSVTLWLDNSVGRDQATIIKHLTESTFTGDGVWLDLKLVDMSVLLRAISAGNGPDVSIFMDQATPVNYGMRHALYDLSAFDDLDEVLARFSESAVTPFRMGDKLYALPESQSYPMLFYRKDILAELGLSVPQTWQELTDLVAVLQKKYMVISLPTPASTTSGGSTTALNGIFTSLLFQHGGKVYDDAGKACLLDSRESVEAFIEWSELYTKYKVPVTTNALSYFRTGDAPIVIENFSFANSLAVGAPEIRGLWDLAPMPGTKQADGTVARSCGTSLTACVIYENAKDPAACWSFLKWWTSADTQTAYGREIEALQGLSGRWLSANIEAKSKIGWNTATKTQIDAQFSWVRGVPEVAGGYYVGRSIDNAVKAVINTGVSPRETLLDYVGDIQQEIDYKRKELRIE